MNDNKRERKRKRSGKRSGKQREKRGYKRKRKASSLEIEVVPESFRMFIWQGGPQAAGSVIYCEIVEGPVNE